MNTQANEAGFEQVPWKDVVAVGIRTTADGPFAEDVFWQFLLRDGFFEVPGSWVVDLDPIVKRLPGVDFEKVIKAMSSCEDRTFRVWHVEESSRRLDEPTMRARFAELVARLGSTTSSDGIFRALYAAWSSDTRRYHDVEHLGDCLREVGRLPASASRDRIELALFYHDAVYEPGASDSEARSAAWIERDAATLGIPSAVARSASDLVEATAHSANRVLSDEAALVSDIDLSILGRDPLRFMEFEHGVSEEYAAIPAALFYRGRRRFLAGLLEKPIYRTAPFRDRFEAAARANITALLESPRYARSRWLRWFAK